MKNQLFILLVMAALLHIFSSHTAPAFQNLEKAGIIPKPLKVQATGSFFQVRPNTRITINRDSEGMKGIAGYVAQLLRPATGFDWKIIHQKSASPGNIHLMISNNQPNLGDEGYKLMIARDRVILKANECKGLFRGIQTIRQLFPPEIERKTPQDVSWKLATGTITDYPTYSHRGSMLDVARHFFPVEDVKAYIDWLARYKMNVLHLHLSDDQGWRIEINGWPKLTRIGGSTEVGGGKGGYYTQEEYKEIVRYARERYITVIPEIDMPGHTNAALASYPELNCDGKAPDLYTGTKVGFSSLCTHKEITYRFIEDVISQLSELTPGPYMHIGGDESHATEKQDYITFINRVQDIVTSQGKTLVGWNEIAEAGLNPESVVQLWHGNEQGIQAAENGNQLIMSPSERAYLDMKYDSTTTLGLDWAGYIEVDRAYNWSPETYLPEIGKEDILGVECPLWTETVTNREEMEYLVLPRLLGYAEIGWTPASLQSWEDYKLRLAHHGRRLEEMGVNFYRSDLIPWK